MRASNILDACETELKPVMFLLSIQRSKVQNFNIKLKMKNNNYNKKVREIKNLMKKKTVSYYFNLM